MRSIKPLFSGIAVYGIGILLCNLIAFVAVPLYTHLFSPAEYGVFALLNTVSSVLALLLTIGLDSAQSYFFMEMKNKGILDVKDITTSVIQLRVVWGVMLCLFVSLIAPLLTRLIFSGESIPSVYLLIVAWTAFVSALVSQSAQIFRLLYRPWPYIGINVILASLTPSLIILFVWKFGLGLEGYFIGGLLAAIITVFIAGFSIRGYLAWQRPKLDFWLKLVKYGLPLLPSALMGWVMLAIDRWFVLRYLGRSQLGIYAVGAGFASLILLAVEAFRRAWWPMAMDVIQKEDAAEVIRRIAFMYVLLASIAAVILTVISPFIIHLLVAKKYYSSWRMVGILCWASIFYGFYLIGGLGIFKSKKTYLTMIGDGVGAASNVGLNVLLIPIFGMLGAACATSISVLLANVIAMLISNQYLHVKWQWGWYLLFVVLSLFFIIIYIQEFQWLNLFSS